MSPTVATGPDAEGYYTYRDADSDLEVRVNAGPEEFRTALKRALETNGYRLVSAGPGRSPSRPACHRSLGGQGMVRAARAIRPVSRREKC